MSFTTNSQWRNVLITLTLDNIIRILLKSSHWKGVHSVGLERRGFKSYGLVLKDNMLCSWLRLEGFKLVNQCGSLSWSVAGRYVVAVLSVTARSWRTVKSESGVLVTFRRSTVRLQLSRVHVLITLAPALLRLTTPVVTIIRNNHHCIIAYLKKISHR